jgi:hypothetical protein
VIGTVPFRPRPTLGSEHESDLHGAVAQFLRLALRRPTAWTTFPAGGGGLKRGRMLARLGLRPGWPDLLVMHPTPLTNQGNRHAIVLGIELKTEVGRQSLVQRAIEAEFAAAGAGYAVCRTIDGVYAALIGAGIPVFAVPMAVAS